MTFKAFKEAQRLQGVQRGSKDPEEAREILSEESRVRGLEKLRVKHGVAEMPHRNKKTHKMEKIEIGVLQRCNTLFLWHNSVCHCGTARHNI